MSDSHTSVSIEFWIDRTLFGTILKSAIAFPSFNYVDELTVTTSVVDSEYVKVRIQGKVPESLTFIKSCLEEIILETNK